MQLVTRAKALLDREDGAITVDWVVLTAAVMVFCAAATYGVSSSLQTVSGKISGQLQTMDVSTGQ